MEERVFKISAMEVARLSQPTVEATVEELIKFVLGGCIWSYNVVRELQLFIYGGLPLRAALEACERIKHPVARAESIKIVMLLYQFASGRDLKCHRLNKRALRIRPDLKLYVKVPGYFVEDGVVKIVWMQPRKFFAPDDFALGMFGAMVYDRFIKDEDWPRTDVEFGDFSAAPGTTTRRARCLTFSDMPKVSREEVAERLQIFAEAVDILLERGISRPGRPRREPASLQLQLFER